VISDIHIVEPPTRILGITPVLLAKFWRRLTENPLGASDVPVAIRFGEAAGLVAYQQIQRSL
jgi:hypothetical protein